MLTIAFTEKCFAHRLFRTRQVGSDETHIKLRKLAKILRSMGKLKHRSRADVQTLEEKNASVDGDGFSFVTKIEKRKGSGLQKIRQLYLH